MASEPQPTPSEIVAVQQPSGCESELTIKVDMGAVTVEEKEDSLKVCFFNQF